MLSVSKFKNSKLVKQGSEALILGADKVVKKLEQAQEYVNSQCEKSNTVDTLAKLPLQAAAVGAFVGGIVATAATLPEGFEEVVGLGISIAGGGVATVATFGAGIGAQVAMQKFADKIKEKAKVIRSNRVTTNAPTAQLIQAQKAMSSR